MILERLKTLHPKVIDLSLDRVERLLAALGHPERRLPPVVHVAGTNGKGSVLAFLRAMLEAGGYRVHAYTSPHLVRFHERIRLAGTLIAESRLGALLEECEAANRDAPITFFEITTAAAFLAFTREPADVLLLETGLGGRLDATNVVDRPALAVITPVSSDHHQYLGESLAGIAAEKAGILKPGTPAVVARQPEEAAAAIAARACEVGAPLIREGREWTAAVAEDGFTIAYGARSLILPAPALSGRHQIENAATAVVAALSLDGYVLPAGAIENGLRRVEWPARLQRLARGALAELLPEGWELWLDGGHNAGAGAALAEQTRDWTADGRPLHLVFGMLNSKAPEAFLAPLAPHVGRVIAVPVPGEPASLTAAEAADAAHRAGLDAAPAGSVRAALAAVTAAAPGPPARVLVCGSLYLAGAVLRENA